MMLFAARGARVLSAVRQLRPYIIKVAHKLVTNSARSQNSSLSKTTRDSQNRESADGSITDGGKRLFGARGARVLPARSDPTREHGSITKWWAQPRGERKTTHETSLPGSAAPTADASNEANAHDIVSGSFAVDDSMDVDTSTLPRDDGVVAIVTDESDLNKCCSLATHKFQKNDRRSFLPDGLKFRKNDRRSFLPDGLQFQKNDRRSFLSDGATSTLSVDEGTSVLRDTVAASAPVIPHPIPHSAYKCVGAIGWPSRMVWGGRAPECTCY